MPRRYPPEFRRKVLDLVAAGRSVAEVAADLGVAFDFGTCGLEPFSEPTTPRPTPAALLWLVRWW
jgi:hypothetical protein